MSELRDDDKRDESIEAPRTVEAEVYYSEIVTGRERGMYWVKSDFAQQLERELAEANVKIAEMRCLALDKEAVPSAIVATGEPHPLVGMLNLAVEQNDRGLLKASAESISLLLKLMAKENGEQFAELQSLRSSRAATTGETPSHYQQQAAELETMAERECSQRAKNAMRAAAHDLRELEDALTSMTADRDMWLADDVKQNSALGQCVADLEAARSAIERNIGYKPGDVIVPEEVFDWLMGEGPEFEPSGKQLTGSVFAPGRYWWRSQLRERIAEVMQRRIAVSDGGTNHG